MATTSSNLKVEDGPQIKPDPANATTPSVMDEDEYEDTGELLIPGTAAESQAWLAKLPKWLWEAWSTIAEDEEVEIGKVRVFDRKDEKETQRIKIILRDIPGHAKVPKEYDVRMNKERYNNTIVFSEKDQPGFKASAWGRDRRMQKEREAKRDPNKVSKKAYKSSIPKQTALAGYLQHEVTVTAVENDEYRRLTNARFSELFQPKQTTTFTTEVDTSTGMVAPSGFAAYNSLNKPKTAKKKQQEKAVRISQEALLDLLHQCFKEYRYWSMNALKQRLKQPEAFIKSVLDKIAFLNRGGTFNAHYQLNKEYEDLNVDTVNMNKAAEEDIAQDSSSDAEVDLGEDDEFEDVKMEDN